jgi:hypothetical protein
MKSIPVNSNKRGPGRPRTGIGKVIGVRLYPEVERALDAFIAKQKDPIGRPEAIRRILTDYLKRRGLLG